MSSHAHGDGPARTALASWARLHQTVAEAPAYRWAEWDLAGQAAALVGEAAHSPFLDPAWCERTIAAAARTRGADGYAGGYLEDRRVLWRGSYLDPERAVHLGVDVGARVGTPVCTPVSGRLRSCWQDPDQAGGWGGRVIVEVADGSLLVLAHLDLQAGLDLGGQMPAGTSVGRVAPSERNGGWFPHLHVQRVRHSGLLATLDGYGPAHGQNQVDYPDPWPLLLGGP